jgi:protein-L-isoaspartate(D-aspartate) O-methyltransferase
MSALPQPSEPNFVAARLHMVDRQIRPNKVRDERVLSAFETVPREIFLPASMAGIAYIDDDVPVATGRFLLEPMVLARLIEEARITKADRVLDVAPATGYSTAILASLASAVVGIEADSVLQKQGTQTLASLKIANASIQLGSPAEGYATEAPYNVIIVNGGAEVVPSSLFEQLAEGGRLMIVVRQYGPAHASHAGEARIYEKIRGQISHRSLFDANVNLLEEFLAPPKFIF